MTLSSNALTATLTLTLTLTITLTPALPPPQSFLLGSLADEDTSIRRRVVDLLFLVCTDRNANAVVKELLAFLGHAEVAVKEDVALKAAVLAEKFAPDNKWYVDTLLTLLR